MKLPEFGSRCIQLLESAGFAAYAVGGCVRDDLLGLPAHDLDLCTDALPEQTEQVFADQKQDLTGVRHGTVRVWMDGNEVEITTFRSDGSYADNRHPDSVQFVSKVEEDLARRDFTVNAIAWSPRRGYADPFGGIADLNNRILRTVGDPAVRFQEDSLRILRGMRFAAKFRLEVAPQTMAAMMELAPLTANLARERVFEELTGFLLAARAEDLLRFAPILAQIIPEVGATVGFLQHSPHHAYDVFTHTAMVTGFVPCEPALRWGALLHDIGKVPTFQMDENGRGHFFGHAQVGASMAEEILTRFHAGSALRERTVWLIGQHMLRLAPERKSLRRYLSKFGMEAVEQLLSLQEADMSSKGVAEEQDSEPFLQTRKLLEELKAEEEILTLKTLDISGNDLLRLGYSGKSVGEWLNRLLELVLEETLPNDRDTLLQYVTEWDRKGK